MNSVLLGEYQKKSGKTKTHLAKAISVSRPTIYKIFANPSIATYGQAEKLSEELGIDTKEDRENIFLP